MKIFANLSYMIESENWTNLIGIISKVLKLSFEFTKQKCFWTILKLV